MPFITTDGFTGLFQGEVAPRAGPGGPQISPIKPWDDLVSVTFVALLGQRDPHPPAS